MKRWLMWGAALWLAFTIGLLGLNPSWPLARRIYVAYWQQIKDWNLDPCRSCPPPDRFK